MSFSTHASKAFRVGRVRSTCVAMRKALVLNTLRARPAASEFSLAHLACATKQSLAYHSKKKKIHVTNTHATVMSAEVIFFLRYFIRILSEQALTPMCRG